MAKMEPHAESDFYMEQLRRQAETMSRDELLMVVHHLSHAYSTQRAATAWAINEASQRRYGNTA